MQKSLETIARENLPVAANKHDTGRPSVEKVTSRIQVAVQPEEAATSLANHPEMDSEKIEQIKRAIMEGTYRIDPERIADKLIALELEFHHD